MRTLIFSDSHLTNRFNESKFKLLQRLISSVDQVIINGDFWDGHLVSFDAFINSDWKKLFPLLKSKNTIYIFGNHDREQYVDERASLFSVRQLHNYSFKEGKTTFHIEHGNRLFHTVDDFIPFRFINRILTYVAHSKPYKFMDEVMGTGIRQNKVIKMKLQTQNSSNSIYICGHSHAREHDLENNYINSGYMKYGVASYVMIENGVVELLEEKY